VFGRLPTAAAVLLPLALLPLSLHARPHRQLPVIDCFGDSITAGYCAAPGKAYPNDLQTDLAALGYRYRVVNSGISGNTTKDGVDRLDEVLRLHPAVVLVEFGGNDGLRGIPIADTRRNLDTIVSTLLRGGSKVVLLGITLPPNYGPDYIRQFDAIFPSVADRYHIPVIPNIYQNVYTVPHAIQADGVHPTALGAELLAHRFLPVLEPLLHREATTPHTSTTTG
jgi:acyl-CoA thioesterase-1